MAKNLKIELSGEGEKLTVKTLIERLEGALAMLRSLAPDGEWEVVMVRMNSPLQIAIRNPRADRAVRQHFTALRKIKTSSVRPPHLTDTAIDSTLQLAESVEAYGHQPLRMSYGRARVEITPEAKSNLETMAATARHYYYEMTTIRGMLYEVVSGLGIYRFRIEDPVTKKHIQCNFQPDRLKEVKDALQEKAQRVEVYGRAKCSSSGEIKSIDVRDIRPLVDDGALISEAPGIDITGGADSVEHVERIRGR
ncbi:MAG: hypothetical protein K8S99_14490 [Planctomycetes bacterium]|nr:hypothetical protein [Planctomycetota bacterium]